MIILRWQDFRSRFATSSTIGVDGVEAWPVANVRASGFDGGLSGIGRPIAAFPLTVSCNALAVDGGAAFDWYLSQRTDDPTLQWISVAQYSATQSGTVTLALTSECVSDLDLSDVDATLTEDQIIEILKHCTLYVKRLSDGAIQLVQLLQYTLSNY